MISLQHRLTGAAGMPRRTFLKRVLAAAAASALPIRALQAMGRAVPLKNNGAAGDKVNLACCGIGARGGDDVLALHQTGLANLVAFCDVDMGGPQTLKILKQFPDVPRFKDFREMLDKLGKNIDAVCVGVPDHSHFPIAMLAMSMGKHVYVEKPLAHTFQETELLMQAEKKYKVAAQMGNQGHSGANYFQFKAWTEAGIIKHVTKITAFMNMPRRWHGWKVDALPEGAPIPKTLDWDKWLTATPFHPFDQRYVQGDWRCWYDFGNGSLGDWGAHILDTAHQFLELGLPEEIHAVKLAGHNRFIFPQASTLSFKFPARGPLPPVKVTWYDGVKNIPPLPRDVGHFMQAAGKVIYGEGLTFKGGTHDSALRIIPESRMKALKADLPPYPDEHSNHYENFLLACQGREQCRSSFDIAGPLSQVLMLGVIAQRLNTKLVFDRITKQITNNPVANQLLAGPPPRQGWEQYYRL